ncbi:CBS domain-containing protein [Methylobacterium sp. AMS5]|uniref:CBS domain-containing protein n=1 Tax=Methylobacterium sp. AMS5 TaxID=925818 RepID=UPI00074FAA00|nr:CBS domain-containing protein [Methylobacterium sp. AMS5]AMB43688.1 Chloride channel core [Methylobacterium sp. AMS5]
MLATEHPWTNPARDLTRVASLNEGSALRGDCDATRPRAVPGSREVDVLDARAHLADAIAAMEAGRHQAYPVLDAARRPVGLATRGQGPHLALDGGRGEERLGRREGAPLAAVHPGDVVAHALDVMTEKGQGRLVVTDPESGALVGLLTRRDLLQMHATTVRAETERRAYRALLRFRRTIGPAHSPKGSSRRSG